MPNKRFKVHKHIYAATDAILPAALLAHDSTASNQRLELERAGHASEPDFWFADDGVSGKVTALQRPVFVRLVGQMNSTLG